MAVYTVSNTGGNYNVGTTWVGGVVPSTTDTVDFAATSGNLTISVAATCAGIDFTNYTGTITVNAALTINGNINLGTGGYSAGGSNTMYAGNTGSITSNGTTWTGNFGFIGVSQTHTLVDDLVVTRVLTFNGSGTHTINGFSITALYNVQHITTSIFQGTTKLIFGGTGSWTHSSTGTLKNNVDINTTGTTTFGTNVRYNTGTLKYVAGTVVTTSSTFTMDLSTTLDTNGTSINFNNLVLNGTGAILTLTTDCYATQFTMGVNNKTINGANLYNGGSLAAPSNTGNVQGTSTIIMNGTGTISAAGGAYIGINVTIDTAGTITLATCNYGFGTFKYITGTVISTGNFNLVQASSTLDTAGMIFNNLSSGGSSVITLISQLTATGNLSVAAGHTLNFISAIGFTVGGLSVAGTLILAVGPTYTITTNMVTTAATLASPGLIRCATINGTKAILNLQAGATQDNGYVSATDIDSSGGRSIWTYKGTLTRTINWNQMSTNPKKHVLNYKNRILK